MKNYKEMSMEELRTEREKLLAAYDEYQARGLSLNIARGKPGDDQLDLSMPMLDVLDSSATLTASDGVDARNYGVLEGIPEARALFGEIMDVDPSQVIIFGNSSLNIMFDTVARSYMFGVMGATPWSKLDKVKFLCPVPGYDRHFGITARFGIEMINIPMTDQGPDMDLVEQYVNHDETVKGIWCVPLYSNPGGCVYSDETVKRFAALKPAAEDFRIYWDNAYIIHHLYDEEIRIPNIIEECAKAGNPDMVYQFCSTSKITFPGSGVAAMSTSPANVEDILDKMKWQTIGHDKINQLRHVRFFKNLDGIKAHMKKHAAVIRPKFDAFLEAFDRDLEGRGIASWTRPRGGYFISFSAMPGCAKDIVARCKDAGLTLTGAGAAFPYGKDPEDSNIRIAPTFSSLEDIRIAADLFSVCVRLSAVEKLLAQ